MRWIRKVEETIERIVVWLTVGLFFTMLFLAAIQVVLRTVFNEGILWIDPANRHLLLWVGFLGATVATIRDKHFAIDVLHGRLSQSIAQVVHGLVYLLSAVVSVWLAAASVTFVQVGLSHDRAVEGIPISPRLIASVIPAVFGLMAVLFTLKAVEACFGGTPAAPSANEME